MNTEPRFPVLRGPIDVDFGAPESVPWGLVAPHETQALRNHGQTIECLAERGGLSVRELWAVLHDKYWAATRERPTSDLTAEVLRLVAEYKEKP